MIFSLPQAALLCIGYMVVLFGIALLTERGWIADRWVRHPVTYVLSLGILISAWEFYGIVDLASQYGYGALAYYLGIGALFLFAPMALTPLVEIARRYQVRSLADLLVFRYHSHSAGSLATLCMVLAVIPLVAVQLMAVAHSLSLLTANSEAAMSLQASRFNSREALALTYCGSLAVFTIWFGANREKHRGLITAMAFESIIKIVALLLVGGFALFNVFGGLTGLDEWLAAHPTAIERLYSPARDSASHTLLLVFITAAVAMPHIFHMAVVENPIQRAGKTLPWAIPLMLLLIALPIFPILWAGQALDAPSPAQYYALTVPMEAGSEWLTVVAFVGGLAAATGAQVVITLALTTMLLNHWLLPVLGLDARWNVYRQLLWLRRGIIFSVFLLSFLFFQWVHNRYNLTNLALLAFIAGLQLLPGIIAINYWPRGNSRGLISGLAAGLGIWTIGLLLPVLTGLDQITLGGLSLPLGFDHWNQVALWSLSLNALAFVVVSQLSPASYEEHYSAALCTADEVSQPMRHTLDVTIAGEFKQRLEQPLGRDTANSEVDKALAELGLNRSERRPYALRRLRDRLEANLSGLMGIAMAGEILDRHIPYKIPSSGGSADITLIENQFASATPHLSGVAAELNNLRLYYRKTLQELPMAICSLGPDLEILMWNKAMEALTGIDSEEVTGSHLSNLAEPWHTLIKDFSHGSQNHSHRHAMNLDGYTRWLNLHKAAIAGPGPASADSQLILVEDVTELQQLENELMHSERLASVGRLAAGVAHEIGNPVTGIACLAQNIRYDTDDPELLESVEQIVSQTERISRILQSLVSFSHAGQPDSQHQERVSLAHCAAEAIQLLSLQKDKTPVRYLNQLPPELVVMGDSQRLIQVFVNLLANARDASEPDAPVTISGERDSHWINLIITDQGEGIDPEQLGRILEPFYTTKEPGEGTGLGLSLVYSIVTDHQGQMDIHSPVDEATGRGSRFTLQFPHPPPVT